MGLMARLRWLLLGVLGVVSVGLAPGVASAAGCANEALRTGLSANLPDCRAYEMVSPVEKNGGTIAWPSTAPDAAWESSVDGSKMAYVSTQAFADAQTGSTSVDFYIASRGVDGWSSHSLLPPQASGAFVPNPRISVFSPDLSNAVLLIGGGGVAGQDSPPLVSGEPQNTQNLFVRDNSNDSYRLVDVTPAEVTSSGAIFEGASSDLSHVVFRDYGQLTANALAEGKPNLYEWADGVISLVSVLPGGAAAKEASTEVVSKDGLRVVWQAFEGGFGNRLYLREDGVRTVQLDASQGPGPGGGGRFLAASDDGSKVFFSDDASAGLTADTVPGSGVNLYEYEAPTGRLTDLTPDGQVEVQEHVFGSSGDGSYLYFVAKGALAGGATAGQPNLYVQHEGTTKYIATLSEADELDWKYTYAGGAGIAAKESEAPVRVTPDGLHLAFDSAASLTGYDNRDALTGEPDSEVFLYDAATEQMVCASCNPSGARPRGRSVMSFLGPVTTSAEITSYYQGFYRWRYFSPDGTRLFFNSFDSLVPRDTNGKEDVYEFEDGAVRLISAGTSGEDSQFLDASVSGGDVFFYTAQQLVAQDDDAQSDLYDARVGGGFPAPLSQPVCGGEGCRAAPSGAPALGVPGSATFAGVGNLAPAVVAPTVVSKPKPRPKPKKKVKRRRGRAKRRAARGARGAGGRGHSTGKRG
jgi:hypothetical protein